MDNDDPLRPTTSPLHSFKQLAEWEPGNDPFNVSHVPLKQRPGEPVWAARAAGGQKRGIKDVIVCHDMAGGYTEDRYPLGTLNGPSTFYTIQYWQYVDIFICTSPPTLPFSPTSFTNTYTSTLSDFSHARIAPPPPGWTAAAHRNGVKVLGTVIAEGEEGTWETLRMVYGPAYDPMRGVTPECFDPYFAEKLVSLAKYYGFEGYLINMESPVPSPRHAWALVEFLDYLTMRIKEDVPGGLIIWYDALTIEGKVEWQDRLSNLNKPFYTSTSGLFTNYTWPAHFPHLSTHLTPHPHTIYTGIDVWGRNTFGGGGRNVHKALRVIEEAGTGVALFAPGWNYEGVPKGNGGWEGNERRFWCDVGERGCMAVPNGETGECMSTSEDWSDLGCIKTYIPERLSGTSTSFYTDFDRGYGTSYYINGQ
ncbi:hypothetical protein HK104_006446, partial [Borealophlyctis nickersoniae]